MPNRVIREAILDSPRYWSVKGPAKLLLFHLFLLADDFGLVNLDPSFVRRRCFSQAPGRSTIEKQIADLLRADLVRTYRHGDVRYGFIPRFRQTLRILKAKCPLPPLQVYRDDPEAVEKFQKNNNLFRQMQGNRQAPGEQAQSSSTAEVEVKGKELKGNEVEVICGDRAMTPRGTGDDAQQEKAATGGDEPVLGRKTIELLAAERGLVQRPGESKSHFRQRAILRVLEEKKTPK